MTTKQTTLALLTLILLLALPSIPIQAGAASAAALTCQKRLLKEVKTVTPFSLSHRPKSIKMLYDDIACGLRWRQKQCSSIQASFDSEAKVYDFNTLEEISINAATFVRSSTTPSPMGSGLTAFSSAVAADTFLAQQGAGEKLIYQDLLLIDWQ